LAGVVRESIVRREKQVAPLRHPERTEQSAAAPNLQLHLDPRFAPEFLSDFLDRTLEAGRAKDGDDGMIVVGSAVAVEGGNSGQQGEEQQE
jgi:hypothetical protein